MKGRGKKGEVGEEAQVGKDIQVEEGAGGGGLLGNTLTIDLNNRGPNPLFIAPTCHI
jgi:hypothetical protein